VLFSGHHIHKSFTAQKCIHFAVFITSTVYNRSKQVRGYFVLCDYMNLTH